MSGAVRRLICSCTDMLEPNLLRLHRAWAALFGLAHDLIGKPVSTFPDHAHALAHDLIGKPVSTFPDHAHGLAHDLIGKPVSTFPDHAHGLAHDLIGKPVSTFPDHALTPEHGHADDVRVEPE